MVKIYRVFFILTVLHLYCAQSLTIAQEMINKDSTGFKPNVNPELSLPKLNGSSIKVDGKLDEAVWKDAAVASNFTEISPGDNVKPEVETKVYIFYDDDNIYFGYVCYDDMSTVRGAMCDRDHMYQDDWVGPFIDTYNDQKQAFEFYVNPKGIQGDLIWTPGNETTSPDFIYESEAHIYKDRWTAEIKIPFKSLRFPDKQEQIWRIHLLRNRPRGFRQEIYWASVSRDNPNFLGQAGLLKGIKNVKGGKNLEILPYVIGNLSSHLEDPSNPDSKLVNEKVNGDVGIGLKYGITSNLTLDATVNPDFSQVEADAPKIDINTPFALFYEEKRPFFLEGSNNFQTFTNIIYSRSVNNPLSAVKLTGKAGKFGIGFLSAYDENTPFLVPLEERSFVLPSNKNSMSNILRLKYDLGGENYIGTIFSDREESVDSNKAFNFSSYNRVFGFDGRFNFISNYYLGLQLLGYSTRELNDTSFFNDTTRFGNDNQYTAAFDGERFSGFGGYLSFNREARGWSFFSEINLMPPEARSDNGFITRNNLMSAWMLQEYNFYPKGKLFQRINPEIKGFIRYDTKARLREQFSELDCIVELKNGLYSYAGYFLINNESFGGIYHTDVRRFYFGSEVNNMSRFINGGFRYENGKYIVRFASPSYVGKGQTLDLWFTLKPLDRLRDDFSYTYSDLSTLSGEKLFAGYVLSNKLVYQFNKNFFFRVLFQYDLFNRAFNIDPLLSYKWNPYTVLYLGSTHNFEEISSASATRTRESSRQIFLKFQYLWRM